MRNIKQAAAANIMVLMVDATDHITGVAGETLTVLISKDGGAFGAISPVVTDRSYGWYNVALTATDTDTVGDLALHITSATTDPSDVLCFVGPVPSNIIEVNDVAVTGTGQSGDEWGPV